MTLAAEVRLWGTVVGVVTQLPGARAATFQYHPEFLGLGIEPAPLMMPVRAEPYTFPDLPPATFHGLPGLLADALPDRFGNALIDAWLATQGRTPASFTPMERLCYTSDRGMGALEFAPRRGPRVLGAKQIDIGALVALASDILTQRGSLRGSFATGKREEALRDILRVGTSAGGARAKAIIAWNPITNEVRAGHISGRSDFQYWLIKFDGVRANRDKELDDPQGFGAIEYAYYLMARAAGLVMAESRLLEEGGRRHFMTRRFDRTANGQKLHMQTLGAMAHLDFNHAGAHTYEQALFVLRRLGGTAEEIAQLYRRMIFNVVARNQDDHVKNISFLMDKTGAYRLAPAYDVTYAHNPDGAWTAQHQMRINGKQDGFTVADFRAVAKGAMLPRNAAADTLAGVVAAVARWPEFAHRAGVPEATAEAIGRAHRLEIPRA